MSQEKYIGMEVYQGKRRYAMMDAGGKLTMECLPETQAAPLSSSSKDCMELHL